jgi:AcrR family transcriptional regulator
MKETREHILHIALQLFMQKGYKEVTMKNIVDNTGLSKGAFYHYFNSKEQVFEEVIKSFYSEISHDDFNNYAGKSLHDFYSGILTNIKDGRKRIGQLLAGNKSNTSNANYYYLIFDAMRLLPQFRKRHEEIQHLELQAWIQVVRSARESNEIESNMTDEQIAKLFIYTGDGININRVMTKGNEAKFEKELKLLWDNLYNSIKVQNNTCC